jgi:hypothetical protein
MFRDFVLFVIVLLSQKTILLGQNTSIGWSRPVKYDREHQASALLSNAVTLVVKRLAQRVDADRGHEGCVANRVGLPLAGSPNLSEETGKRSAGVAWPNESRGDLKVR